LDDQHLKKPSELRHIGEAIAVITVDGNMMGRIFQNTNTPADYTFKSETFDRRFKSVLKETIRKFVQEDIVRKNHEEYLILHEVKEQDDTIVRYCGINPVYIGGDDLLLIINARAAISFCKALVKNVAKEFRFEHTLKNGIMIRHPTVTVSCGIAIADMKFPVYFLLEAARKMESVAKEEFRKRTETNEYNQILIPDGAIAFTAVTGGMPGDDASVFVLPAEGSPHDKDTETLDTILRLVHLSLAGNDMEKRMISTMITCGTSEEERLNVLKFQYASAMRKQGGTPKESLDTCELLATALTQKKIVQASKMVIPFVWHISEGSS
jgi:hypothetical protein